MRTPSDRGFAFLLLLLLSAGATDARSVDENRRRPEGSTPLRVEIGLPDATAQDLPASVQSYRTDQPAEPEVVDPLKNPMPVLGHALTFSTPAYDDPEAKIIGRLRGRLQGRGQEEEIDVIVTLQEPNIPAAAGGLRCLSESLRTRYVAATAHEFVRQAVPWFRPDSALSHFPMVIGSVRADDIDDLARLEIVRRISPVEELRMARTEGGNLISSPRLRNTFNGKGAGVGVAVLDSGIDWNHNELRGKVASQIDFTGTAGSGLDDNGHGTSVAGIIAGSGGGMAPDAHLHSYKIASADGTIKSSSELQALNSVYANRNNFGGIRVVNLSVGGFIPYSDWCDDDYPEFAPVMFALWDSGITSFAASGNEGYKYSGLVFPACLGATIAVGAVYDANIGPALFDDCSDFSTAADKPACYSNSSELLDILAPSHCASTPTLNNRLSNCFGGTSAATPYAAGAAAQILSLREGAHLPDFLQSFWASGKSVKDTNDISRDRINVYDAFQFLASSHSTTPSAPSGLNASVTSSTSARLTWIDASSNESEFRIWGSVDGGQYAIWSSTSWDDSESEVTGLTSGRNYRFYITARNSKGESAPSNTVTVNTGAAPGVCVPDTRTACVLNNRFRVTVRFRRAFDNLPVDTDAFKKPVTGFANPKYETAFFYFNNENNIEMMVKMLDQGNTNPQGQQTIALLFGTATPFRVELTITDTTNGIVRTWVSEFRSQKGSTDFLAFVK